jgi:hypothetical protein
MAPSVATAEGVRICFAPTSPRTPVRSGKGRKGEEASRRLADSTVQINWTKQEVTR